MASDRGSRPVRRGLLRGGLLLLAATPLFGGLWALILPRSFYDDFPLPGSDWVSTLGPYNEHLIRDYGALNLALTILLVAAALLLERRLVRGLSHERLLRRPQDQGARCAGARDAQEGAASTFGVSLATLKRWLKRRREGEDIAPRPSPGRTPRILATPQQRRAL